MLLLPDHLAALDALPWQERNETAAMNLLAGNVFDWGAKEAAALMQLPGFGFQQALDHLQSNNKTVIRLSCFRLIEWNYLFRLIEDYWMEFNFIHTMY